MPRVVRIGGGSGGYSLLHALKDRNVEVTAVVNMFDSGGSTGVLRDEYGVLPPGDIRRALAALAEGERSDILRDLFNYRFKTHGSVGGHSFGNLLLTALADIYGSDIAGIQKASELLNVKGRVLPVSLDASHLHAVLEDGTEIVGETNIDVPKHNGELRITHVFLKPSARVYEEADAAIREADLIVIGPGDLYTSVIPNLLTEGMREALAARRGKALVITNLMTKWGETNGFCASDMLRELSVYSGIDRFDYALCNTAEPEEELRKAYERERKELVHFDEQVSVYADKVITGDFLLEADIARHDTEKVVREIEALLV